MNSLDRTVRMWHGREIRQIVGGRVETKPEEQRVFRAKLDRSGRVVIPADARLRKKLKQGDCIVMEEDGDGLRLRTIEDVVRDAQKYFRSVVPAGVSLVDELIAERREEAKRE
jgi:bifunctional DNA-binding transcriptional regulator/antitoxin component of YhaV-PrlF toxin-antitoxin module